MSKASRLRQSLEVSSTIAVIVTACVMLWMLYTGRTHLGDNRAAPKTMHVVGDRFDAAELINFGDAPGALVIWVRSGCRYCTESMDFYRRLVAAPRRHRIVVMGSEKADVLDKYVAAHNLHPDAVVSASRKAVRLPATPIVVLVNSSGAIERVWRGRLTTGEQEDAVFDSIKSNGGEQ